MEFLANRMRECSLIEMLSSSINKILVFYEYLLSPFAWYIMIKDENLSSVISSSRHVSDDGSLVTYDLTKGFDASNPRKAAEALATVFFEKDARNWFKVVDDRIEFNPTYKVCVVLAEVHNRKIEETVDDFLKDINKDDLYGKFGKQINDSADSVSKLKTAMVSSSLSNILYGHSMKKVDKDEIEEDLFTDILEKLEIKTLNNEDLINWQKLHM